MGLLSFSYVFKNLYLPILLHSSSPVHFLEPFLSPPPSPPFFYFPTPVSTNLIRNIKPSLINELSLIVLFSAVNTVLITTPSFSMQFFSFFDLLPSAPTITGMISLFNFWYLSIVYFSFSLTLMSPVIGISIMAQLLSFLFTTTICGFRALISLSHWIITSHKIFTSAFSTTPSGACSYHFHGFSGCISHTISNELFLQHYHAFPCTSFVQMFHIRLQYEILFHFSCHTHSTKW